MPISLAIGVAVVVILAGCQQFAGKATAVAVNQPVEVVNVVADIHDSSWISQGHAQAVMSGTNDSAPDLSYQARKALPADPDCKETVLIALMGTPP